MLTDRAAISGDGAVTGVFCPCSSEMRTDVLICEVWVPGVPKTKGSLDAYTMQDTPESQRWRAMMAGEVKADLWRRYGQTWLPHAGPVRVEAVFFTPPGMAPDHAYAGDLDKQVRNLLDAIAADSRKDAMNGGAIGNDRQVIKIGTVMFEGFTEYGPGAHVKIYTDDPFNGRATALYDLQRKLADDTARANGDPELGPRWA